MHFNKSALTKFILPFRSHFKVPFFVFHENIHKMSCTKCSDTCCITFSICSHLFTTTLKLMLWLISVVHLHNSCCGNYNTDWIHDCTDWTNNWMSTVIFVVRIFCSLYNKKDSGRKWLLYWFLWGTFVFISFSVIFRWTLIWKSIKYTPHSAIYILLLCTWDTDMDKSTFKVANFLGVKLSSEIDTLLLSLSDIGLVLLLYMLGNLIDVYVIWWNDFSCTIWYGTPLQL